MQPAEHPEIRDTDPDVPKPERLYGLPGAEYLEDSIDTLIDKMTPHFRGSRGQFVVEEWTVCENRDFLPLADSVIEHCLELADPVTEDWWDRAGDAARDEEVIAAFETAISLLASRVRYFMADEKVGEVVVEVDE